jgi:hypothetical protein
MVHATLGIRRPRQPSKTAAARSHGLAETDERVQKLMREVSTSGRSTAHR